MPAPARDWRTGSWRRGTRGRLASGPFSISMSRSGPPGGGAGGRTIWTRGRDVTLRIEWRASIDGIFVHGRISNSPSATPPGTSPRLPPAERFWVSRFESDSGRVRLEQAKLAKRRPAAVASASVRVIVLLMGRSRSQMWDRKGLHKERRHLLISDAGGGTEVVA